MRLSHSRALCTTLLLAACGPRTDSCTAPARIADLPARLDEASGLALSRRDANMIWAHNDSEGTAMLYAIDRGGRLLAEIALPDVRAQFDWEDIAAGPCPAGDCLYIGDIGDNRHDRDDRAILRIAEPESNATSARSMERFPIRYPDGPEDAEALFVMPDTGIYIITKGRSRPITLYRYPLPLRGGEQVLLERVQSLSDGIVQLPDLVTGADAARDGSRIAVRTYRHVRFYRFDGDTLVATGRVGGEDLSTLGEPQGEAIAVAADTILLATESGPERLPPFLSSAVCQKR